MSTLLMPREVDRLLRYPRGRSLRLAKAGKIPHIQLPDGEIRFEESKLCDFLKRNSSATVRLSREVRDGR